MSRIEGVGKVMRESWTGGGGVVNGADEVDMVGMEDGDAEGCLERIWKTRGREWLFGLGGRI